MDNKKTINDLIKENKLDEAIKIIKEKLIEAEKKLDKEFFTLLNSYTRILNKKYELTSDTKYAEEFKKIYIKMMDNQNIARKTGFDIMRYKNTYQKIYRKLKN
jgi:hypothetical protein